MICNAVLSPVVTVIRTLVRVARQVARTVCEWVSSIITVVTEVLHEVCTWLPWPLSALCDLVTELVETVETIWEWICHDVIETILEWVEILVEYVVYVLKWICWVVDWVVRLPGLLLCLLGIEPPKFLGVCVKVLADNAGNPAIPLPDVSANDAKMPAFLIFGPPANQSIFGFRSWPGFFEGVWFYFKAPGEKFSFWERVS